MLQWLVKKSLSRVSKACEIPAEFKRIGRVSAFLTFLSFKPYLSNGQSRSEKKTVSIMFDRGNGYQEIFYFFVNYDEDISKFSTAFVDYFDISNKYGLTYEEAFNDFLAQDYYEYPKVSDVHLQRFRDLLVYLDEIKIDIFALANAEDDQAISYTLAFYQKHLSYKAIMARKNKKEFGVAKNKFGFNSLRPLKFIIKLAIFLLSVIVVFTILAASL